MNLKQDYNEETLIPSDYKGIGWINKYDADYSIDKDE